MNVYTTSSSGCCTRFSRQKLVKPIVQRYYSRINGATTTSGQQEDQEGIPRAPSTADEFERVAQEKKAKQGVNKTQTTTDKQPQDKEPVGKGNSHKTEDV